MDKLNLIDYILNPDHRAEFEIVPLPEGPDLLELQARLADERRSGCSHHTRAKPGRQAKRQRDQPSG